MFTDETTTRSWPFFNILIVEDWMYLLEQEKKNIASSEPSDGPCASGISSPAAMRVRRASSTLPNSFTISRRAWSRLQAMEIEDPRGARTSGGPRGTRAPPRLPPPLSRVPQAAFGP